MLHDSKKQKSEYHKTKAMQAAKHIHSIYNIPSCKKIVTTQYSVCYSQSKQKL